jgi:hypothetical protein
MRHYSEIEALVAKEAIRSVLYRICRAADRCDAEMSASAFYDDAIIDHSRPVTGDVFKQEGIQRLSRLWDFTHHMIGQIDIELDGDGADSEAYLLAHHITRDEGAGRRIVMFGGRYVDRFEFRGTEWRVARRVLVKDWYEERSYQPEPTSGFHPNFQLQRRDRLDPFYRPALDAADIRRG